MVTLFLLAVRRKKEPEQERFGTGTGNIPGQSVQHPYTQRQELSLNRDNQPIRGRQCVKREQRQRGGTVDQDIIEFLLLALDKVG